MNAAGATEPKPEPDRLAQGVVSAGEGRADFPVGGELLVELKAVEQLAPMLSGKLILGGVLAV